MNAVPYGFRPARALGMVPVASDHIGETINIEMSRLQRETLERWVIVCISSGQYQAADEMARLARSATIINLEARKAK